VHAGKLPIRASILRPARDGAIVACLLFAAAHLLGLIHSGVDAHTYWITDSANPYAASTPGTADAYFYSPAFAQLTAPIHLLSWEWFITLWTVLLTGTLAWQAGLWLGPALLLVPVFAELTVGNVHFLLAAAIVAGFRWPWTWSFVLLTKVTPGVGLLWFAIRREWRSLATALGATAVIAGISFLFAPSLWWQWVSLLMAAARAPDFVFIVPIPLWIRLIGAVVIVSWGALRDHRWTVILASCVALPVLWINGLAMLVGLIPLLSREVGPSWAAAWLSGGRAVRGEPTAATGTASGTATGGTAAASTPAT